jgi:hypothetical protein
MSGPVLFVGEAPAFEERDGLCILTLTSGDSVHRFAMSRHTVRRILALTARELDAIDKAELGRAPIPFRGKRPKAESASES